MTRATHSSASPLTDLAGLPPVVTPAERAAAGKAVRTRVPRSTFASFTLAADRPDPIDLLLEQAVTREPDLIPIRHSRMAASPFAFFRGAALPMAADLASMPNSGLRVQLCGDAHLLNFGIFGTPERRLVFDINDFDETSPGPFEWDVMRLAASLVLAARERGDKQDFINTKKHGYIMSAACALSAFGFYVIYSNKNISNKPHFASLHGKVGLAVFSAYLMLGLVGGVALHPGNSLLLFFSLTFRCC